ncbi:putative 4-hydroxy-4-methyl-2-oxoglutarate aldolase 1 [Dendrobium catenatum]|uniref:Regulator of ribonuclease-like protein 1 n=1 Tax=Dendrobium catenatum TaxID=906689 RepID=A0A2I0VXH4_9ASPA|nr:putative 4-hydroxy-4-methyl-2-oxoglutarate aldolase 1 [Dendrobium catenatum]PKU68105.1 Regulator of ribonuclease-like protein 1 [Dendrobium catenatum]
MTLKVFEDNVLLREFLEGKGNGRILIVDGGGSYVMCHIRWKSSSTSSEQWVVWYSRQWLNQRYDKINGCDMDVRALISHPMIKAKKKGIEEKHVSVNIA